MEKLCRTCDTVKSMDGFKRDRTHRDGHSTVCKACTSMRDARYYAKHAARIIALNKRWRQSNPAKCDINRAAWRETHSQKARESKNAAQLRRNRAIKTAPGRGVTPEQTQQVIADSLGICSYCNGGGQITTDHIDALSKGGEHDVDNLAAVCMPCNNSKRSKSLLVWLAERTSAAMERSRAA